MGNRVNELVEAELRADPRTRNSDKFLIWRILISYGIHIDFDKFMELPSFESITRCRRKLQETYSELAANFNVQQERNEKMGVFKKREQEVVIHERF